ncbi:GIY-YIG nuclease family protein [Legionella israelensis]|nr:GIY-YIG nuclease family protein [Legionella israelensis]QBS09742.1 hypothetical protein E4T55_07650 [Legionella israelensis]SCY53250.1 GIY-YIG catalytic domain-containing protein [Legionella israelensis DSM 19235]STX59282.1 GIY-YIG nuclease superfamily protein [Legionella israelensis]
MKKYLVYIFQNGTLYTGYTDNLEKRYKAHQSGTGSEYTSTSSFKYIDQ